MSYTRYLSCIGSACLLSATLVACGGRSAAGPPAHNAQNATLGKSPEASESAKAKTEQVAKGTSTPYKKAEALQSEGDRLMIEAGKLHHAGKSAQASPKFKQALVHYEELIALVPTLTKRQPVKLGLLISAYYNKAAMLSLQGRKAEAIVTFEQALSAGFDNWLHMRRDKDLDNIRGERLFKDAVRLAKTAQRLRSFYLRELEKKEARFSYDFNVTSMAGKKVALADLKGKLVVANVWRPGSMPISREIPRFAALKKMFGNRLEVVGLVSTEGKDESQVRKQLSGVKSRNGVTFPIALVENAKAFDSIPDLRTYPTTLFIDKAGRVRFVADGDVSMGVLWIINRLLDLEEPR